MEDSIPHSISQFPPSDQMHSKAKVPLSYALWPIASETKHQSGASIPSPCAKKKEISKGP